MKNITQSCRFAILTIISIVFILSMAPMGMSQAQSPIEQGPIVTPEGFMIDVDDRVLLQNIGALPSQIQSFSQPEINGATAAFSTGTTTRVSVSSTGVEGNADSNLSSINANGRYIVFITSASNLVKGDVNNKKDVYINDNLTGWTGIVSVSSNWYLANGDSSSASISADGRFIAFSSDASNLVPGDTNNARDIFVRDMLLGKTTRVSVSSTGIQGNKGSSGGSISADGRYIAFSSSSNTLVSGDTNGMKDVFVHDQQTGVTTLISVSSLGVEGNRDSDFGVISADGRYVVFYSIASNLVDDDTNGIEDIFVHDFITGETTRVSVSSDGTQANSNSIGHSINSDGRFVAFDSNATNLVSGDDNGIRDVFVHDRQTGETTMVSRPYQPYNGVPLIGRDNYFGSINADGRYVTFNSNVPNIIDGYIRPEREIFLHDRLTSETTLVSTSSEGIQSNLDCFASKISVDGLKVAFSSDATNLVPDDTNDRMDVFINNIGGTYSLSGRILPEDLPDFSDAVVYVADEYGWLIITAKVQSDGSYRIIGVPAGNYLLVPWKNGYFFTPEYLDVTITGDTTDQDFTAIPVAYSPAFNDKLTASKVTFSWDPFPGAINYKLQLSTKPDFSTLLLNIKTIDPTYFFDSYLKYNNLYYWRVRPLYSSGKDPWLPTWQFTSMDPLVKPTLLSPEHKGSFIPTEEYLSWASVENADQYKVLIAKDSAFTLKVDKKLTPDLLAMFDSLPPGKYFWRVRAIDPYGAKGPWSDPRVFFVNTP